MKLSWLLIILLPFFVAILNLQNAHTVTVHFLQWELTLSAALMIQFMALFGALVGFTIGARLRPAPAPPPGGAPTTGSRAHGVGA